MTEPLFDAEAEKAALALLCNSSIAGELTEAKTELDKSGLTENDFHLPLHKDLFAAASKLVRSGTPADVISVRAEFERAGKKMTKEAADVILDANYFLIVNLKRYAERLRELSLRRRIVVVGDSIRDMAMRPTMSAQDILTKATTAIGTLTVTGSRIKTLRNVLDQCVDELGEVQEGRKRPIVSTGIKVLDSVIGGYQPTLILLTALPGVGKSAFEATSALQIAKGGDKVGIICLEDEPTFIAWRIMSQECGVNQFRLRFTKMNAYDMDAVEEGFPRLLSYADNIVVYDGSDEPVTPSQVIQIATDMVVNHGCKVVFIDHLGEIEHGAEGKAEENRTYSISRTLSRLRGVANRFHVPMVVLAHLRRREGLDIGDRARASDIADSSGAERKARTIIQLSRKEGSDYMMAHVLKNTNGVSGVSVEMKFIGANAMVSALEGTASE